MPIRERERMRLAAKHMETYFPSASEREIAQVVDICTSGFDGNWSPIRREQDSRHASGQGATYEEFVIYVGRNITHREAVGVTEKLLGSILYKVSM